MRGWAGGAVACVLALAVGAAALVALRPAEEDGEPRALRAQATLSDRIVVFGDTLRAQVDVTLDRRRVDPSSVRVRAAFEQWRRIGPARLVRSDVGATTHLRATYVLRCLRAGCVPERDTLVFDFDPARVEFVARSGGERVQRSVAAAWPRLVLNTRLAPGDVTANVSPWRASLGELPEPSYRAAPGLLLAALVTGSLLLLGAGGALAVAGRPRRERVVEPEPEPPPHPELRLTPLEQALELLEDVARARGPADRRRSLELVADVLARRGEEDGLARSARELAWSPIAPPAQATRGLASRVRATLEDELRALEAERRLEDERRREAEATPARS